VVGGVVLVSIEQAVVVTVEVVGIGPDEGLEGVAEPVAIGIDDIAVIARDVRILLAGVDRPVEVRIFAAVAGAAAIGVPLQRRSGGGGVGIGDAVARR